MLSHTVTLVNNVAYIYTSFFFAEAISPDINRRIEKQKPTQRRMIF